MKKVIIIGIVLCFILGNISWAYYNHTSKQAIIAQAVKEIKEAKEPSHIEILQKELEDNRLKRSHLQINIDELKKDKQELANRANEIKGELEEELGLN